MPESEHRGFKYHGHRYGPVLLEESKYIRGGVFLRACEFIREGEGDEGFAHLADALRDAGGVDLESVRYHSWYPFSQYLQFLHTVADIFGMTFLREMGRDFMRHSNPLDTMPHTARAFFINLPHLIGRYEMGIETDVLEMGRNHGVIEIRNATADPCVQEFTLGILEGAVDAVEGMTSVRVLRSPTGDDGTTVYLFEWS